MEGAGRGGADGGGGARQMALSLGGAHGGFSKVREGMTAGPAVPGVHPKRV